MRRAVALLALPALLPAPRAAGSTGEVRSGGGAAPAPAGLREVDARDFGSLGRVITRGLLAQEEAERLAGSLRGVLLRHGRRAFGGGGGEKEVRFTFAVHELDPLVATFVAGHEGQLWQAAQKLAGTQELCVLMDRGFSKDPGDPETHWHRDDEAVGLPAVHPSLRTLHAWIPLAAMGREMGTLRYVIGTHRRSFGWLTQLLASLWGWEFAWFVTLPIVQDDALELGDVAWHDGWVLHSAGANGAAAVRDGLAVSFAYCDGASECGGAAAPVSETDPTCRVSARLFDERWLARHRSGENDYAKTLIREPLLYRAGRFVWRSVFGALAGLGIHWLVVNGCCARQKTA
mmetsp:Transcript_111936/g.311638  ORF Transcript_111936/g.311638 Transcript_111936/m.311638 type:complete len:346 (-) Transcript_111936:106-1143(-)